MKDGATLTLDGGVYSVESLVTKRNTVIEAAAPTELRVAGTAELGRDSINGPAGSGVSAAILEANVYAPNGTLHLKAGTTATGALLARDVDIDKEAEVNLATAFGNNPPVADDLGVETNGSPVTLTLTGSDPDPEDALMFSISSGPAVGTLGALTPNPGGDLFAATVTYTPGEADEEGNDPFDEFTFEVTDLGGATDIGTVTINPDDPTDPPEIEFEALDDTVEVLEDTAVDITLVATAPDTIGNLTFAIGTPLPENEGTLGDPVDIVPESGPVRSATVDYDPDEFVGTTSFTFLACEVALPTNCREGLITINVGAEGAATPPTATSQLASTSVGSPVEIDLSASTEEEGPPVCEIECPRAIQQTAKARAKMQRGPGLRTPTIHSDQATFLSQLAIATTYDFEQPEFPAASAIIGVVDDVDFFGRIGFAVSPPPPSGDQFMRGTDPGPPFSGPGILDFGALSPMPNAVGFFTGFGSIAVPAPYVRVRVINALEATIHEEFIAQTGADTYFGFIDGAEEILAVEFQSVLSVGGADAVGQQFGIDDLTIGTVGTATLDSTVAWNVADSDFNGLGDESNGDLGGFPGTPGLISATNNTGGGAGSNGLARVHIEWDISGLAGSQVGDGDVLLHTSPGTSSLDTLDTMFYVANGDGNGSLENSDWETPATELVGVVLPNTTGISSFTFDVTAELQAAIDAGFDWFVVQGRVVESPPSTNLGGERGMQIRSQCATCAGADPPELILSLAASPDLIVDSLTHDPANPTTEDNIEFTAVVKNVGTGPAGASTLSFKIGGESPSDPDALFAVPVLAVDETFTVVRNAGLPAQSYLNTAVADFDDDVVELDEDNNTTVDSYTVAEADEPGLGAGLVYNVLSLPANGTLLVDAIPIESAPFLVPSGLVTYTPNAGFIGRDTFGFNVLDTSSGLLSNNATVLVRVGSVLGSGLTLMLDFQGTGTGVVTGRDCSAPMIAP